MVSTSIQVISWLAFSIEIIALLAFCGLRFFSIFKENENRQRGWFVELAIALVIPTWISHFAVSQGLGVSFNGDIIYTHFKLWIIIAPIQALSLIFLANANTQEKTHSTIFFVVFTSVAWAYCSWRGVELAASDNESAWAYMLFGMFIMTMPLVQFVIDILRNFRNNNGFESAWNRKLIVLFAVGLVSWCGFWIDWMIGAQGWNWSWYVGWLEVACQALIDLLATVVFGSLLILMPPSSVLLPLSGENEFY